jgi:hypothetical protein
VSGGGTSVVTNALQRPQDMVVRASPIRSMMEEGVDVVPFNLVDRGTLAARSGAVRKMWQAAGKKRAQTYATMTSGSNAISGRQCVSECVREVLSQAVLLVQPV